MKVEEGAAHCWSLSPSSCVLKLCKLFDDSPCCTGTRRSFHMDTSDVSSAAIERRKGTIMTGRASRMWRPIRTCITRVSVL